MRPFSLAALLLIVPAALSAQVAAPTTPVPADSAPKTRSKPLFKLEKIDWMSGCWAAQTGKDDRVEEDWSAASENLMLATTRYITKGRATGYEFTRIEATDSGIVFGATSNGKTEHVYTLARQASEYLLFERASKEFPQRIIYRRSSDGALIPRNEGEGQPSIELRLMRVRCAGDKK
jgi:hypothetical protein